MSGRSVFCLLASVSLAWSLQIGNGGLWEDSFVWAALAFAYLLCGVVVGPRPIPVPTPLMREARAFLWGAALVLQVYALLRYPPGMYLVADGDRGTYVMLLSAASVLMGLGLAAQPSVDRWRVPLLLAIHLALGLWMLRFSPRPEIDVWFWHHEAMDGLLSGQNPYAMTMPNIYGGEGFFGPGMVKEGRVQVGFVYPPLSLLLLLPAYLIAGDYRYGLLLAMTAAGALIAFTRPGAVGTSAVALWLFASRSFFVLEQGWTETLVVLMLALTAVLAHRRSKWLFVAVGLLLAIKHYLVLALPLLWLLPLDDKTPRARWTLLGKAAGVAAVLTGPFFLVNPKAFLNSLVLFQLKQPFRTDALSFLAHWYDETGQQLPTWLGACALILATVLALCRCERSVSGFCIALAFVFFAFFGFSKQAFCNYYFFILGAMVCSMAFDSTDEQSDTRVSHVLDPAGPKPAS